MTRRHLLIGLATAPVGWALGRAARNAFELTNEADQAVHDLTLEVGGETFRFDHLAPDAAATGRFAAPDGEDVFAVRGRYADGRAFAGTTGYVAWDDVGRTFHLAVLPDGITTRRVG